MRGVLVLCAALVVAVWSPVPASAGGGGKSELREACAEAAVRKGYRVYNYEGTRRRGGRRVLDLVLWKDGPRRFECSRKDKGEVRLRERD